MKPVRMAALVLVFSGVALAFWLVIGVEDESSSPASPVAVTDTETAELFAPSRATFAAPSDTPAPVSGTASNAAAPPNRPGLTISGRVIGQQNQPVPAAVVNAYNVDSGQMQGQSDDQGNFVVAGLAPGKYRVAAQKEHFNEAVQENVAAGTGRLVLAMEPLSAVTGRVVAADTNRPMQEFQVVYVNYVPSEPRYWDRIARSELTDWISFTDPDGRFRIDDVASRKPFAVGARADGYQPACVPVEPVEPGAAAEGIEIRLMLESRVAGRVLSPAGRPVPGASVHLGDKADRSKPVAQTDGGGEFTIKGLGDEPLVLTASHPDYMPGTAEVKPVRGQTLKVDITLGQGGTVEGVVLRGSVPVPGQKVAVSRLLPPRYRREVETDATGRYNVIGVPPGEIEVIVKMEATPGSGSMRRLQHRAVVEAGQVTTVNFNFPGAFAVIEGTISLNGLPPESAEIKGTVVNPDGGDSFFSARAQEDGTYHVENVPPGEVWLEAVATSTQDVELRKTVQIKVAESEHVIQDFAFDRAAGIYGTVSNLYAGDLCEVRALHGTGTVNLADFDSLLELDNITAGRTNADENGAYAFDALEPGLYTVVAFAFPGESDEPDDMLRHVRTVSRTVTVDTARIQVNLSLP